MKAGARLWWLFGTALMLACALTARAAVLEVAPVVHELPAGRNALSMTLTNRATSAVTLQVRAFRWTQEDGEDRLVDAGEWHVAPAIFSLAPGRSQVLRALVQPGPAQGERSYRLLIDELPAAQASEPVRMALRISVPVFVQPAARLPARLEWRIEADGRSLVARNVGGSRERIREVSLSAADGRRLPIDPAGRYVLAGAERRWALGAASQTLKRGESLTLSALCDAGRIEVPLVFAP